MEICQCPSVHLSLGAGVQLVAMGNFGQRSVSAILELEMHGCQCLSQPPRIQRSQRDLSQLLCNRSFLLDLHIVTEHSACHSLYTCNYIRKCCTLHPHHRPRLARFLSVSAPEQPLVPNIHCNITSTPDLLPPATHTVSTLSSPIFTHHQRSPTTPA